jgi:hypothetical protein
MLCTSVMRLYSVVYVAPAAVLCLFSLALMLLPWPATALEVSSCKHVLSQMLQEDRRLTVVAVQLCLPWRRRYLQSCELQGCAPKQFRYHPAARGLSPLPSSRYSRERLLGCIGKACSRSLTATVHLLARVLTRLLATYRVSWPMRKRLRSAASLFAAMSISAMRDIQCTICRRRAGLIRVRLTRE